MPITAWLPLLIMLAWCALTPPEPRREACKPLQYKEEEEMEVIKAKEADPVLPHKTRSSMHNCRATALEAERQSRWVCAWRW